MKKLLRRIWFIFAYKWARIIAPRLHDSWAYPTMVYLEFNKEEIMQQYLSGKDMKAILNRYEAAYNDFAVNTVAGVNKMIARRAYKAERRKDMSEENIVALYERYEEFVECYEDKQEQRDAIFAIDRAEKSKAFKKGLNS